MNHKYKNWQKAVLCRWPEPKERFWAKVQKTNDCWLWKESPRSGKRYGRFLLNGKRIGAHVASWLFHVGSTNGMKVLHTCDTPLCVNPKHLFLGTQADNIRDMIAKNRAWWLKT